GHLVFSTLHTNSAVSAITRLIDIGLERYLLASTVSGVMAQSLVRRLGQICSRPHPEGDRMYATLKMGFREGAAIDLSRRQERFGCEASAGRGFRGRNTISELL